ncbi:MAG TPA: amidohydrolase family protein, partial [Thermoplasmata archaeon]|nr:amidohydrolase family protein [Thermoplasmata archaeon]
IKVFADGSFGARTAALFDPYDDEPRGTGRLVHSPKELAAVLARAHGAGFQLAVHAIGDRAIDVVVEAYARVLDGEPREDHRHRIEHVELPSPEALDRMKELGLVASMQPNFVARWSGAGGLYERRLGRDRLERNNPFREVLARRIPLVFGSDGMPYGPLYGTIGAVGAPFGAQRIPALEALRCYTASGAFASFEEGTKGALAAGRLADFVVLSGDPRRGQALRGLAVEATVVAGRRVYRRPRRPRSAGRGSAAQTQMDGSRSSARSTRG